MGKRSPERWRRLKERMRERAKTASFWLVLLALLALLVSLWVMFGDTIGYDAGWIYKRLGVTEKAAALKTLGFIIAGAMASWGVVAANRRADAMDESAKATAKSAEAADNTANVAEAGNRQRAFQDGLEHLGSDKASVRLIGSRALFYVAMEDERQRVAIASFLCAYIRETTGDKDYQEQNKDKPSTEMQSLLKLLFTTETMDERRLASFWRGMEPDLEGGYFRGVELSNAQFRGAKLNSVQFQGASLREAQFQETSLKKAQFQGARLREAQFQGAYLEKAQFQVASLTMARLQGADLDRAQFQGALLFGSQFQGASPYMAGFQQAKFGQGSEHEDIPDQDRAAAKSSELVEQLKASAFHGISSSERLLFRPKFDEIINERAGKASDFSGVIFAGGVTKELLAEVKEALERASRLFVGPVLKEGKVIQNLESEIGQPESHTPPKGVIAGSYGKEDAGRWMREFRKAMATVPGTNQAA